MLALDVDIPKVTMMPNPSSDFSTSDCQNHRVKIEDVVISSPACEAARMSSMKKLRHRLVVLSNKEQEETIGSKAKIPVLSFERWLARYALRRHHLDITNNCNLHDPLIPSDGHVDTGLVKDLSMRSMTTAAAERIALVLATEAQKATVNITEIHSRTSTHFDKKKNRKNHKKEIKAHLRKVKEYSKGAIAAFEDAIQYNDSENNNHDAKNDFDLNNNISPFSEEIRDTLKSLRSATETLQESILRAQSDNKDIMLTAHSNDPKNSKDLCGGISINGARREGIYDITLKGPNGKPNRPYLTISASHLSKLIHLWTLQKQKQNVDENLTTENADFREKIQKFGDISEDPINFLNSMLEEDQPQIRKAIYCCLSRYEALRGAGYQCAVPASVFQAAATKCGLDATIECFASPLNCRYRNYCSAFPDIETSFGSIGNFFDDKAFNPEHGTYEANPPFVPETMFAMGKKIQRLLDDPKRGPLSFLVIIPAWGGECENSNNCTYSNNSNPNNFCYLLEQSCHTRAKARISAVNHAFLDGSQHTRVSKTKQQKQDQCSLLRPSSWDTAVILMQNDAGKCKWPVDEQILKDSLCGAFEDAAKEMSKDANSIQKWEDRGVAKGGSSWNRYHQHENESHESIKEKNENKRPNKKNHNSSLEPKQRKFKKSF